MATKSEFQRRLNPITASGLALGLALFLSVAIPVELNASPTVEDGHTASLLADFLRAGRKVISGHQALINDPKGGDKGLTGERILNEAIQDFEANKGYVLTEIDPQSPSGKLLNILMDSVRDVMTENQATINAEGVGLKGFLPAVFARLVTERFDQKADGLATMRVTAPYELVRNRRALPDAWETTVIEGKFRATDWTKGKPYLAATDHEGRPAVRVLYPEYYAESCLSCHGSPAGELDITGYPKEGVGEGELAGIISITLYQ